MAELYVTIYKGLYDCYHAQNHIAEAHKYYVLYSQSEKNVLKAENNRQLTEMRILFDSEKKEKANEVLRKENELKAMTIKRKSALIWLTISALAFTILLSIYIYNRFNNKRKANIELERLNEKILHQNNKLEVLNQELKQANKEKDKILSIIGHELRNPLFWFQNLAEVLSKRYATMSPEKVQKSLAALDESAKNAFHLMDNLLNWSRSRLNRINPRYGQYALEKLVNESTRMFDSILKHKGISLFANIPDNASAYVDPDLFSFVVRNLVSNAIKYTPNNGFIDIDCTDNEHEIIVCISDSGVGIPLKNIDYLFDPNENFTKPGLMDEQGSGFGLKLCKEFTELNHGKIWVNSLEGKGTRFTFTIPKLVN
jgi:signal transduction histidine kinase